MGADLPGRQDPRRLCCLILALVLRFALLPILLMLLTVALFVAVMADLGLMMNLLKPNFNWTSENVPVKQGLPVSASLFGGWILSLVSVGVCAALGNILDVRLGMAAEVLLLAVLLLLLKLWMKHRGCRIFEEL